MFERCRTALGVYGGKLRADAPWLLGLVLAAAVYYGLYFRCGFNLADEGSVALLSQRILEGERPLADLMLGYNLLWFYPIVALFWLVGVNVLWMKVYFCALATLSAGLGYLTVRKISGQRRYAFAVGLLLIAIPATSYRVYLPLLVIANLFGLTRLIWSQGWTWPALGGLILGLTYLVRIDLGIFFSVIWLGAAFLRLFLPRDPARRWAPPFAAMLLIAAGALAVHLPFYFHAQQRGFAAEFVRQYPASLEIIRSGLTGGFAKSAPAKPPAAKPPAASAEQLVEGQTAEAVPKAVEEAAPNRATMGRRPVSQIWKDKKWRNRVQTFVTYAPILSFALLLLWALLVGGRQIALRQPDAARRTLSMLVLAGGAMTLFPQFFGFRPDMSHLAEFMPGLVVAAAGCGYYLFEELKAGVRRLRPLALSAGVVCLLLLLHVGVWSVFAFSQRGAGTIFTARPGRNLPFHAENGVDVLLNAEDHAAYSKIRDLVAAHSKAGEYVVCYPYAPGINVLSNRPTYEWSLYVDNVVRGVGFDAKAIARMEAKKPAVVVINDWAVNRSEDSRFSVWAKATKEYVAANYRLAGTYLGHQVYVRQ